MNTSPFCKSEEVNFWTFTENYDLSVNNQSRKFHVQHGSLDFHLIF